MKTRIATALATGALLANTLSPLAFADTTIELSGNGSSSTNNANVNAAQTKTVVQSNNAHITNTVHSNLNTGGNDANDNTGGDVVIDTGNASSHVDLSTKANLNVADLGNCDCDGDTHVLISGNGSYSDNNVNLDKNNTAEVFQDNHAWINNDVHVNAKTGYNDANRNTGGDVTVVTGHARSDVAIQNKANANIARIGSNGNAEHAGQLHARIVGNGSYSDNDIDLDLNRSVAVVQDNEAWIRNHVDANLKTGYNDANDNTGGDVVIDTGNALSRVAIDNLANFNSADVDCGCIENVDAKISGNGSYSDNRIYANLADDVEVFQGGENGNGNRANFDNYVEADGYTGKNDANRNTGDVASDPAIFTGAAFAETNIRNASNANFFGSGSHVDFDFDLHELWESFHN